MAEQWTHNVYSRNDVTVNTQTLIIYIYIEQGFFKFNNTKLLLLRDENVNQFD